jgi:molybdate/tungstate transport system permease protein
MAPSPPASQPRLGFDPRDPVHVLTALGGVLLVFYLLPLLALFVTQSPAGIAQRLGDADVQTAAATSVLTSGITTIVSALFGIPLAHLLARSEARWSRVATALVVVPLVFPPVVSGMLLLTVFGPQAWMGGLAADAGLPLTRSVAAIVLAQTFVASPFVVITAKSAFERIPRSYEQASRLLGKGRWTTFRRVTLPLAWPGIVAGLTLTFARSMGEFGATLMMAYYPRTMPVQIWVAFTTLGLDQAFPIAALLALISIAALVILNALGTSPWTS